MRKKRMNNRTSQNNRNRRKRAATAVLSLLLLGAELSACASGDDGIPESDRVVNIVATNFALYDFARLYEDENIRASMLIAPGSESHDFEATLSDVAVISEADIFLYAGGESDDWTDALFDSLGDAGESVLRINALEYIETLGGESASAEHPHGEDDHEDCDEHTWTSIPNAVALIEEIGRAVQQIDETKVPSPRVKTYVADLLALDAEYRTAVENAARTEIVVADRFPFTHLAEEYGLSWLAAFDGCSSNTEVPLAVLQNLIQEVREQEIPVVFYIEFSDQTAANAVRDETGAEALPLHSCHNVTKEEFEAGVSYLDLMRQNLENLKKALY